MKIQILALPRSATQSVCKWLNDSGYEFHHEHFTTGATEWPSSGMVIETDPLKARSDADRTIIINRDIVDCVRSATNTFSKGRRGFLSAAWDELRKRKKKLDSITGEVVEFNDLPDGITGFDLIGSLPYLDNPLVEVDLPVDDDDIVIERTFNAELVIVVMNEMWDSVSEDNAPNYYPDMYDEVWLKATKRGEVVCLYRLNKQSGECFEVHIFCRYAHRKVAVNSTRRFYEWVLVNLPYIQKIEAGIPVIYPKVIAFSKKVGFEIEGLRKSCFRKNTKLVDVQSLGLTKDNLKRFLWQQQWQ